MDLERGHEGWTVWRGLLLGLLWARAQISARIPTFGLLGVAAWATTFYFARRLRHPAFRFGGRQLFRQFFWRLDPPRMAAEAGYRRPVAAGGDGTGLRAQCRAIRLPVAGFA